MRCAKKGCGGATYVTGMCEGLFEEDSGKSHNHCGECTNGGTCIADYRNAHCRKCGEHYFRGNSGFACEECGARADYHEEDGEDEDDDEDEDEDEEGGDFRGGGGGGGGGGRGGGRDDFAANFAGAARTLILESHAKLAALRAAAEKAPPIALAAAAAAGAGEAS